MRRLALLLALAGVAGGCSFSGRALVPLGVARYTEAVNATTGGDLPERMVLVGADAGADLFQGAFGVHASTLRGEAASTTTPDRLAVEVSDVDVRFGFPLFGDAVPVLGLVSTGVRTVRATSERATDDDVAFLLRPMLHTALPVAGKLTLVATLGLDVAMLGEPLALGSATLNSNMIGPSGSVGLLYRFCDC